MRNLDTPRLILRRFRPDDWRDLHEYVSRRDVTKYDHEYPSTDEGCRDVAAYFSKSAGIWAVCMKDTGRLIGHIVSNQIEPKDFLTRNLGFVFNPAFHGKGYATEACSRVIAFDFVDLGTRRIETHCHPDNAPSWRLLERLGMRREGHHIKSGFIRRTPDGSPIWWDSLDYALLKDEWEAKHTPQ